MKIKTIYFTALIAIIIFCCSAYAQKAKTVEQTKYYLGEVKMSSPTGQPYGSSLSLVKRTVMPAENKIVEIVTSIDPNGAAQEFTTVIAVKNSNFTVKDNEGTFDGTGAFIGTPWRWSRWKYSVNMIGERKGTLIAEDRIINGAIVVKKSFYSPDKQLRVMFAEDLRPVGKEVYEILHKKLLAK